MRVVRHLVSVLTLALLGSGCANVEVLFDEGGDLSQYRTWDWLETGSSSVDVVRGSADAIDSELRALIAQRLDRNGYRHAESEPDFYIAYRLVQRSRDFTVYEPSAVIQLSSLDSSPSYVVEGSRLATRRYAETRLGIAAFRSGVGIWHAKFGQYDQELNAMSVPAAAEILLERLPRRQ